MRSYFHVESYLSKLNASDSITSCDPVPLPNISEKQNYIFISYAHKDYRKVYADLAVMYHAGVRFWYDRGLVAGKDWDAEAKRIIENPQCVGVIFFLSENLFLSGSANKEINLVRGDEEQARKNYFCVNLTEQQPSHILRNIMRMDDSVLDSAGLDMERIEVLAKAFGDKMTYLRFSDFGHGKSLIDQISAQFNVMETVAWSRGSLVNKATGTVIPITEDNFVVGRNARKCHHCVSDDPSVSVVHFSIRTSAKGAVLMDFGSTVGTFVNGQAVGGLASVPLNDSDEIVFGNQVYLFQMI